MRAARELIAREGLRGVSVREVARHAGVDPALIYRHFPNKEQLFIEALRQSFSLIRASRGNGGPDFSGVGEKVVFRFLRVWGRPRSAPIVLSLLRAAAEDPRAARQFRQFIEQTIIPAARADLGPAAERRAPIVGSVLLGAGVMRYLLHVQPLMSMTDEELARQFGPLVSSVLSGSFDPGGTSA